MSDRFDRKYQEALEADTQRWLAEERAGRFKTWALYLLVAQIAVPPYQLVGAAPSLIARGVLLLVAAVLFIMGVALTPSKGRG